MIGEVAKAGAGSPCLALANLRVSVSRTMRERCWAGNGSQLSGQVAGARMIAV
jgi:hypothetical protein